MIGAAGAVPDFSIFHFSTMGIAEFRLIFGGFSMLPTSEDRPPESAWPALRWICTNNPFYAISAALFLAGLWISFGDPERAEDTTALMTGLAGYTLLLAGTACLLVRFAKVWDDARTVLLLVVLLFLATSVTFDHTIVFDIGRGAHPIRGYMCNTLGLVMAIVLSAVVLRVIKLRLPIVYRWPYYLLLMFFFLYPLALAPFLHQPRGDGMMWGLFAFSSIAGLIFLTLLPAVRQGFASVRKNGSPWPWPLYPWSLFGLLALAVPGRAILLCYSMHLIDVRDLYDMTFGPYFLVPFAFALAILFLEAGIVTGRSSLLKGVLAAPVGILLLSVIGHRQEPIYVEFLERFTQQLGGTPFFCTLVLTGLFYFYAMLRGVAFAIEGVVATLAGLAFVGPSTMGLGDLGAPRPEPLLLAATLLFALGIYRRGLWRCLFACLALAASIVLAIPLDSPLAPYRWILAFHLVVGAMLVMGVFFDDDFAWALRFIASSLLVFAAVSVMGVPLPLPGDLPVLAPLIYPLAVAMLLATYGLYLWHPSILVFAGFVLSLWLGLVGWQVYKVARQFVVGLDYLTISLIVFALAITMSLAKSGHLGRGLMWLRARMRRAD